MVRTRSDWRESGVLKWESLRSLSLALLLTSRDPSNVILAALVSEELWEIEVLVSSAFVASPFGVRLTALSA